MEKKEVKTTQGTEITKLHDEIDISISDIQISRLKLIQANSDLAKEGVAKAGALVDTDTYEEFGYKDEKAFEFIILNTKRYWLVEQNGEFSVLPGLHKNEYPWEEGNIKRTYFQSFYILRYDEFKEKDALPLPYEISFSSTGLQTASVISKFLIKLKAKGLPPYSYTFKGISRLKKKGTNSWFQMQVSLGQKTSKSIQEYCHKLAAQSYETRISEPQEHNKEQYAGKY